MGDDRKVRTIRLDDAVWARVKAVAAREKITAGEWVSNAIVAALASSEHGGTAPEVAPVVTLAEVVERLDALAARVDTLDGLPVDVDEIVARVDVLEKNAGEWIMRDELESNPRDVVDLEDRVTDLETAVCSLTERVDNAADV